VSAVFETTRRRYLAVVGGTVATGSVGYSVASQNASASASVHPLDVPSTEYVLTDNQLEEITLSVDCSWQYSGNADAHGYELQLLIGTTEENTEVIATQEKTDLSKQELTGESTLQGDIFSSSHFDSDQFSPSRGSRSTDIVIELRFEIIRDGEIVKEASATDTATIEIRAEELEYTVELTANGQWGFETA